MAILTGIAIFFVFYIICRDHNKEMDKKIKEHNQKFEDICSTLENNPKE